MLLYVVQCTSSNGGVAKTVFSGPEGVVVTGLTNGGLYTCKALGANAIGTGPYSAPSAQFRVSAPPAAPTGVSAAPGSGSAIVSFTPGPNGGNPDVAFVVQCTSSNGGVGGGNFFTASPATVTGLTNGKTYTCTVIAAHAQGASAPSSASNAIVIGVPSAPTAVSATPRNGEATVSWTAPANNGSAITNYIVTPYIGAAAQTAQTFNASATSRVVTGLTNSSVYTFKVAAVNARGTGAQSTASNTVTVGTPAAPPAASAVPGAAQATVSWTAPANNGSAITGYQVVPIVNGTPQAPRLFASTATSQVITGLTNGTTYTFAVAAVNARGTGLAKTTAAITVGAPTAPPLVTATAGAGKATVTWTAPASNNGAAITNYIVTPFIGGVAQTPVTFNASQLTRQISGLTPGTAYTFTVSAVNSRGTGPASAPSNSATPT